MDTRNDIFGEQESDPSYGRELIVDVRTLETLASHQVELTEAERSPSSLGALDAARRSGEGWPGPLIIEMTRTIEEHESKWRITTCDTETNEFTTKVEP